MNGEMGIGQNTPFTHIIFLHNMPLACTHAHAHTYKYMYAHTTPHTCTCTCTHTHTITTVNSNYFAADHGRLLTPYGIDRAATIMHRVLKYVYSYITYTGVPQAMKIKFVTKLAIRSTVL